MKPSLRVDIAAAEAAAASDVQDTDNDHHRLLKLSHSLRYQLAQPPRSRTAQRDVALPVPGALRSSPRSSPRYPTATRDQSTAFVVTPAHQSQQLAPINGPGTRSGPYSGFASKAWLQSEFRQDLDELRQHVDEYVTKREQRAFDLERTALKAEIAHLRKRLGESEDKVVKLQTMLPDDDGEFRRLRAEVEELEREADHFCDLYEREAKATSAALAGFRQALGDINDIEMEFQRIKQILDTPPQAAPAQPAQPFGALQSSAPGTAAHQNRVPVLAPGGSLKSAPEQPEAASSLVCFGCIRITRRGRLRGSR